MRKLQAQSSRDLTLPSLKLNIYCEVISLDGLLLKVIDKKKHHVSIGPKDSGVVYFSPKGIVYLSVRE